jgi:hypothetical protein
MPLPQEWQICLLNPAPKNHFSPHSSHVKIIGTAFTVPRRTDLFTAIAGQIGRRSEAEILFREEYSS